MKRLSAAGIATALVLVASPAFAAWVARNAGNTTVSATSMPAGAGTPTATPSPAANSSTVQVTFTTSLFKGAALGSYTGGGYKVTRYAAATGGTPVGTGTTCSASPCAVAGVPDGTWYFAVAPVLKNWNGAPTTTRAQVSVDTAPPSGLTITGVGASGNAETLSGNAGTAATDQGSVSVVVCATNTFPCASPEASATRTVTSGAWTWTTPGIGKKKHYAQVTQLDTAGNQATAVYGPFTT